MANIDFSIAPGLRIGVKTHDGRVKFKMSGVLSKILKPALNKVIAHVEKEKPALIERDKIVFSLYVPPFPDKSFSRFLKNQINRFLGRHGPDAATIAITQRCPCNCVHCSAYGRSTSPKYELSTEEWKEVVDQLLDLGTYNITFTGGEPLQREDIRELIRYVDKEKAITQIFTCGYHLTRRVIADLKDSGLHALHVSIDTPNPGEHDVLRGVSGLFKRAINGVKEALAAGLLVGISTYATPKNIENKKLEELLTLAEKLGVHEVTIFDVVPTGRLLNRAVILRPEHRKKLIQLHKELNRQPNGPRISAMAYINSSEGAGCFGGDEQIHITPNGEVTPCDFTPLSFGNVKETNLKDIWNKIRSNPAYRKCSPTCRMQKPSFRKHYIQKIPEGAELPYSIDKLS